MGTPAPPLGRVLVRTLFICCGTVLGITAAALLTYELVTFRQESVDQLQTLGTAIASNSTAALAFDNPEDATAVLAGLRADPHITAAALYDAKGNIFTTYPAGLPHQRLPAAAGPSGYTLNGLRLSGFQPVTEGSQRLGTLYVESDLGAMLQRFQRYAAIVLAAMGLSLLVAYAVSRRLHRRMLNPITALADTARAVSDQQDYSVRAASTGTSEFDMLAGAFNHMLTQIQESERKVHAQLGRMGLLQHITRAVGERQDIHSIFQVVLDSLDRNFRAAFDCVLMYDRAAQTLAIARIGAASRVHVPALGMAEGEVIPVDANGLSRCMTGQLVYEPEVADVPFPFPRRFAAAGLHSLVIAPLIVENEVSGALVCARQDASAFSSAECEFLRQLSEHTALASHQAGLYTALQRAYDDLRQSQLTLLQQERLRALGQMASGIAHDINNAISPVSLYTESLLEREPNLSERARGYLTTIQRAIDDVARTVARMREFYRDREAQLTLQQVDLNRAVRQVVDLTQPRWGAQPQQRGVAIELRTELAADLPAIMGADNEIRDALTNLVFNAVDAMPSGGALTLRTRAETRDAGVVSVVVEVGDSGIGMDEETRRRCLEPFFTTKGERGTGLGLAMVYGMIQRHSAGLEIDSTPGQGTTMRLVFAAASASTLAAQPVAPAEPGRPLRLLLVDDDPMLLSSLQDILREEGHTVTPTGGGEAGIAAFSAACGGKEPFDLVITDLGMPYVDGRRVAAAVKSLSQATPVLLLTGWGQRFIAANDMPPNVDKVLSKPPRLGELRAAFLELKG
ncbi:MAG TPA: ATP-binding protein [Steroidobacteraceae bacterium]|nr:ATP-binding protein [Steroidobacteraceae bacterium]